MAIRFSSADRETQALSNFDDFPSFILGNTLKTDPDEVI
jgi:hypothetical protein